MADHLWSRYKSSASKMATTLRPAVKKDTTVTRGSQLPLCFTVPRPPVGLQAWPSRPADRLGTLPLESNAESVAAAETARILECSPRDAPQRYPRPYTKRSMQRDLLGRVDLSIRSCLFQHLPPIHRQYDTHTRRVMLCHPWRSYPTHRRIVGGSRPSSPLSASLRARAVFSCWHGKMESARMGNWGRGTSSSAPRRINPARELAAWLGSAQRFFLNVSGIGGRRRPAFSDLRRNETVVASAILAARRQRGRTDVRLPADAGRGPQAVT